MTYTTNHTMLQKMREGSDESWTAFREFYKPLIIRNGKDYRLTANEIDSLIQDVVLACYQEHVLDNYDRTKGRFRDYLRTITRRNALRILAERKTDKCVSTIDEPNDGDEKAKADLAWKEFLMDKALQELKETMDTLKYMAFEMYELQGNDAASVAKRLGIATAQVYVIRSRTIKKLQEIVARLESELN